MQVKLTVNGNTQSIETIEDQLLLWVLREELGLTGTKFSCGKGQCDACAVLVNGQARRSCITPINSVNNASNTTIESQESRRITALQQVWNQLNVPQCGYCQSGQIVSASVLFKKIVNRPTKK